MYMLDTDICIYIIKRKPRSALKRLESLQPGQLAMSAITFAELMNGAKKSKQVDANIAKLKYWVGPILQESLTGTLA
jgi:tRNA(fMet)-specific endonuclease VapC